jgi:hypothetical protein
VRRTLRQVGVKKQSGGARSWELVNLDVFGELTDGPVSAMTLSCSLTLPPPPGAVLKHRLPVPSTGPSFQRHA